jgi:ABC-2 type transport system ATP-binding protein
MEYAIEINHLEKTFKKDKEPAVKDLSLKIKEGELYGLLGVNGAGKSTTIKMLSCLIKPSKGDALIEGHSILKEPEVVKDISSYSPQESAVATNLTVEENLTFMANVYGMKKDEAKTKVEEMLNSLDLTSVRKKKVGKLSGGYARRLSIALALVSNPRIIYLDEPTLGLDVLARRELWKLILGLKGKITIILTSHYMEEVEALADRVGIINKGSLVEEGTIKEILAKNKAKNLEEAFIKAVGEEALL